LGILAAGWGVVQSIGILGSIYAHPGSVEQGGRFRAPSFEKSWDWFSSGSPDLEWGVMIDGMAAMMLVVVTVVSLLVQIYSLGYQHGKPRFSRYYAYLSFLRRPC
jgi:NADH:ubiquinone oxidoreductase subunit 5 (subunit L)/multisubunit Na+/H+ antiporter MnhA subunit